jgi:Uncharacterised nucleotidyltransferase
VSTTSPAIETRGLLPHTVAQPSPPTSIFDVLVNASSCDRGVPHQLLNGIDWNELLLHARHHSLTPHLAHWLLESAAPMPVWARTRLKSEFQANLQRNFLLLTEARKILVAWRANGIAGMPYKGPVLAEQLWDSFALRECSDLDFLVRRSDVDRAGKILARLGYAEVCGVANHLRPRLLHNASEEQFRHRETEILLELQWAPAPRTLAVAFDESALWREQITLAVAGDVVQAPDPAVLLGLLAIHGWKHNWSKLIWVADIAALVRRYELNWTRVQDAARRQGWMRILALGLEMARRIYGAESPLIADGGIAALAEELEANLREGRSIDYVDWHRYMLRARDSWVDQTAQVAKFTFTPGLAEYSAADLPRWAASGYRAVRLARVLSLWPEKALT